MSGMIETMARAMAVAGSGPEGSALFAVHWAKFGTGYIGGTTAALKAMREPTPEMIQAMKAAFMYGGHSPYSDISVSLGAAFSSTIDAELQEVS